MTTPQYSMPQGLSRESAITPTALPKAGQAVSHPVSGLAQPQVIPPIKSRTLSLPYANDSLYANTSTLKTMLEPESAMTETMAELLAWTGLERIPLASMTPVIAVSGSTLTAAGLASSLVHHHDVGIPSQKVAILEWGQAEGCLLRLLDISSPNIGLNELFNNQCDLTHLVLNAKVHRFIPQLYAIGQGSGMVKTMEGLPKLSQLMAALSKKFHRIVLSLPSYEQDPRVPEMLARLGLNYCLFYDPDEALLRKLTSVKLVWRNGVIQRLT